MKKSYEEKIKGLFANEEFVKKFEALDDAEKVADLFKEFNVDMTEEELNDFLLAAIQDKKGEELDADSLDEVSGGIVGTALSALGATWKFAVNYWGGTRQAVNATVSFWVGVFR